MLVHRPADIQEQQHLHRVVPLRHQLQVERPGIVRRRADRVRQIEFRRRALPREPPQPAQRQLDVARADLDVVVQVAELAPVPHLHRAAMAGLVLADPHAFGIVAIRPERRGPRGADPLRPALVPPLLLAQQFAQPVHQRLEPAHRLDLLHLLGRQQLLRHLAQPFLGDLPPQVTLGRLQPLEALAEHAIETVQVTLVLHQRRAAQVVEILHAVVGDIRLHRRHQRQVLGDRGRHAGLAQREDEVREHGASSLSCHGRARPEAIHDFASRSR